MGRLEVSQCCCGCNLRDGSLGILWTFMVLDALFLFPLGFTSELSICNIFEMILIGLAIYGINQRKHSFMIPFLIISVIVLVVIIILWMGIIFGFAFIKDIAQFPGHVNAEIPNIEILNGGRTKGGISGLNQQFQTSSDNSNLISSFLTTLQWTINIFIFIYVALKYYFTLVLFSYFQALRRGDEDKITSARTV